MSKSYCFMEEKACNYWVEKYFKDCLCNLKDEISFGFGFISLICWGIAEIPQIITNFHSKSSHGVSLAFLLTWFTGDVFNLVGCLLEPATLPTQFYTALLYTASTIILIVQSIYYDYICRWWNSSQIKDNHELVEEERKPLKPRPTADSSIPIPNSSPKAISRREFYFKSARSLAGSDTPPFRTYLRPVKSGPSATLLVDDDSSSSDDEYKKSGRTRQIPRSVGYGTFLATTMNLPSQNNALNEMYVGFSGRRMLRENGATNNGYGQWLGWLMAAIYMGGRIPQIYLNIKRGSVEGLNPLMFIFAVIANVSYVGSIVVRTTEWAKIKANMPWLLDAIVCVGLDLFIILQYNYYRNFKKRNTNGGRHDDEYWKAGKANNVS